MPSRLPSLGFRGRLAVLALLGLAVRFFYVLVLSPDTRGTGDAFLYTSLANWIADGHGYTDPFPGLGLGESRPTAFHPPLFPHYLAVFSWLGIESQDNHRLAGCLLGAGTVGALGLLGRRVGGTRAGLVAAALAAVYPALVAADGAVMSESLYGLLVALTLVAAYRLVDRPTLPSAALLGALIALAALTRAEGLLLLVFVAPPAAWLGGQGRWGRLAVVAAACALVLLPYLVRNWVAFDRPVPVATSTGGVLAGANCRSTYEGRGTGSWDIFCVPPLQAPTEERQQAAYRRQGLRYMRRHAEDLPRVLPLRVLRTWNLYQPWWEARRAEGREVNFEKAGVVFLWVLLPLAAAGAWTLRRRGQPLSLLVAPMVMVTISSLVAYGLPRFREAADISLVVLGAVALVAAADRLRARRAATGPLGEAKAA